MGAVPATLPTVSVEIFVIKGGLDAPAKTRLIAGSTEIIGRHLGIADRIPVYIVIHEIAETNWGIFGSNPDLAALRATSLDAPSISPSSPTNNE